MEMRYGVSAQHQRPGDDPQGDPGPLRVGPGDRIKFFINPDGTVVILPKLPATALKGIVRPRKSGPVSIEEMDSSIASGAVGRAKGGGSR